MVHEFRCAISRCGTFSQWYASRKIIVFVVSNQSHFVDLLGDFVTLFCWKLSRRPPSDKYPYGFGKFEVLGTTTISLLLTGGAIGIGIHSWSLFSDALTHTASHMSPGILHDLILQVSSASQQVPVTALAHSHTRALDPNAAWFAGISVIAKEWLYRITKKVADEERSPVLLANAVHHRSDAYSSLVAFVAILGSWWFPHLNANETL